MFVSSVPFTPVKGSAGEVQQQLQLTNPSSRQAERPIRKGPRLSQGIVHETEGETGRGPKLVV
jgi:hypothetical protein